jgi:hypothetical protein
MLLTRVVNTYYERSERRLERAVYTAALWFVSLIKYCYDYLKMDEMERTFGTK